MANFKTTGNSGLNFEEASVDEDPGAAGYGCNPVRNEKMAGKGMFYIDEITDGTVTLQYKRINKSTWTDYDDYTAEAREKIDDTTPNIEWRAIVKDDAHGTGTSVFGIEW